MITDQFSEQIPNLDKSWTNSGQILDKFRMSETITFWNIFRTINSVWNLYIIILNIFRTFSGHSVFMGGLSGPITDITVRRYWKLMRKILAKEKSSFVMLVSNHRL